MYKSTVWDTEESDSTKVITWWFTVFETRNVVSGIPLTMHGTPGFLLCSPTELCWTALKFTSVKRLGFPGALNSIQNLQGKKALPTCLQEWFRENKWAYKGVPKLQDPHHKSKLTFPVSLFVGQKHKMEMNSLLDCVCFRRLKSPLPAMKDMSNFSISFLDCRE